MEKSAKIALITPEKNIILYLRDTKASAYKRYWEFLGGKIEPGETPVKTVRRELKEEVTIGKKVLPVYGIEKLCELNFKRFIRQDNAPSRAVNCRIYLFRGYVSTPVHQIDLHEGRKLGEFTLDYLKQGKLKIPVHYRHALNLLEEII